eukprot:GGOE01005847.1.p1 GENE.GGOE01005847.1~~GGOE01005847.1.p1  ORF type:complete len:1039 (-),score=252.58 GGOE01005847.1:994-4038(-)
MANVPPWYPTIHYDQYQEFQPNFYQFGQPQYGGTPFPQPRHQPPYYGQFPGQFTYQQHQYPPETYESSYGQFGGAQQQQQPQQPRAGDTRKGLNIVDPKEREQQRQQQQQLEASGAPPPKKSALPIKDPQTKQPINMEQVQSSASQIAAQTTQQAAQPPQQQPQAPKEAAKKKVIPILHPVTRKEVTPKAVSTPSASTSTVEPEKTEPMPSSSSATPAPSTPRSVGNSEEAAVASQSSEEANSSKPPISAPESTPGESLVFAPGATWGAPKLTRQADLATSSPVKAAQNHRSPECEQEITTETIGVSQQSGRRVYDLEFLLSIALKAPPPPELLKGYEVYCADARLRRIPENNGEGKGERKDRRSFGSKVSPTNYGAKVSHFDGDVRSKMGKTFVPGPPGAKSSSYEQLTNRADTAFNVKNARSISSEAKVLKKVQGILNKVTPEKYSVLFDELWNELYVDGQVDVSGIVEQVIHTVFDIALDQPKFSYLYADICFHLCRKIQSLKDEMLDMSRTDSTASEEQGKASATLKEFRRILLNTCQVRFEEGSKHQQTVIPDDADPAERDRIEKLEQRYKARSLGNIKFIAELFKRSLLSERIMHVVIKILLLDTDHTDARNLESMETLIEMLNQVGKKLDRQQVKVNMDMYFDKLAELAQVHPIKRIRFLVLNMVELRKANWVTRQDMKQTQEEVPTGGKGSGMVRNPSWVPNGPDARNNSTVQRSVSYNKEPVKEKEKEKAVATDKDGFKLVGRSKPPNAWEKPAGQATTPSRSSGAPASPIVQKPKSPTTPTMLSPAVPEDDGGSPSSVPPLSDEQIAAKARGLLEEWAADPTDVDNALAVLREEIPCKSYSQFLMGMLLCAISQNKREKERAELPCLCFIYHSMELIQEEHLTAAFLSALQKAKRDEMWVDVPRLWKNISGVLCACISKEIMDLEALAPMCEALASEEDYPELPSEFLKGVFEAMNQEEMDIFDAEKASNVVTVLSKKRKIKSKKVSSLEEFETALDKIFARAS